MKNNIVKKLEYLNELVVELDEKVGNSVKQINDNTTDYTDLKIHDVALYHYEKNLPDFVFNDFANMLYDTFECNLMFYHMELKYIGRTSTFHFSSGKVCDIMDNYDFENNYLISAYALMEYEGLDLMNLDSFIDNKNWQSQSLEKIIEDFSDQFYTIEDLEYFINMVDSTIEVIKADLEDNDFIKIANREAGGLRLIKELLEGMKKDSLRVFKEYVKNY